MLIAAENDAYSFSENDSKKLIAAGSDANPLNEHEMITQKKTLDLHALAQIAVKLCTDFVQQCAVFRCMTRQVRLQFSIHVFLRVTKTYKLCVSMHCHHIRTYTTKLWG